MDNLKQPLINLGFSAKEADIYITLLDTGPVSYTALAKKTGIKRTSLYLVVERMQKHGLIYMAVDQKKITATAPEQVFGQLQNNALQFHKIIPQLKTLGKDSGALSRVQFYSGIEGIKRVYREIETELPPKKDRVIRVISDGETWDDFWNETDPAFTMDYLKAIKAQSYNWKVLASGTNQGSYSKENSKKFNFEVKMMPAEYKSEFDMEIHPNHLIISNLKINHPYAVKIVSPELAQAMINYFDFSWNLYEGQI